MLASMVGDIRGACLSNHKTRAYTRPDIASRLLNDGFGFADVQDYTAWLDADPQRSLQLHLHKGGSILIKRRDDGKTYDYERQDP